MQTTDGYTQGRADDWLTYRGRWVNVTFMIKKGEEEYLVTLRDGHVTHVQRCPHVMPCWAFALVAGEDAWQRFWADKPQPRFHDLMAMVKFKTLRVEGDPTIFMSNLLYFKELVQRLGGQLHAR